MSVDHIMPDEAARRMDEEGYVYIDVRSIPEFEQNHPDPAVNIPILHADLRTGQMIPNPDFLQLDHMLIFFIHFFLFLAFITKLAKIKNFANRRVRFI